LTAWGGCVIMAIGQGLSVALFAGIAVSLLLGEGV
jgi:hypothetical protein